MERAAARAGWQALPPGPLCKAPSRPRLGCHQAFRACGDAACHPGCHLQMKGPNWRRRGLFGNTLQGWSQPGSGGFCGIHSCGQQGLPFILRFILERSALRGGSMHPKSLSPHRSEGVTSTQETVWIDGTSGSSWCILPPLLPTASSFLSVSSCLHTSAPSALPLTQPLTQLCVSSSQPGVGPGDVG